MARLVVRDLSPEVMQWLRNRAIDNGRSAEAEARAILSDTVAGLRPPIVEALRDVARRHGGLEDLELPARSEIQRPVAFGE